jgi:hypothetical protein
MTQRHRIRVIEPETDDKLLNAVREEWRNRGGYGDVSLSQIACVMIAENDAVAACAHPMDYRGMDIPDFEGLECRIVALLPQVMRECIDRVQPPRNMLRMFLFRIFPPLFVANLIVMWCLA